MGRLVGLAWAPTLLVGVLEASVVCNGEDGVCEGLVEAFLTNGSNKSEEFDLGCATTEAVPFCWWAIEIGQIKWMLYTNGMSELVERNIRPFCEKVDEFYGFSFTNKTIGFSYIDQKQLRSEKIIETRQILVDVFYFCCSRKVNCTAFSESASEIKVINALANKMLSYIIRASGFSGDRKEFCFGEEGTEMVALPGVDVCIFVADSTTKMKIYNGPMMFNRFDVLSQVARSHNHSLTMLALEERLCLSAKPVDNNYTTHLKDGECLRYSSADGYFLYCCCYVRRELCAYAIDEYALENNSKHTRRIWRRSAQLKKIHDVSLKSGELVTGRSWAYRDFIFSKPANRRKGRTASENNISLWHCAEGEIVLKKNGEGHHSNDLEKVNRTDLPSRSPACYFDVSIGFKSKGYGRDAQNVSIIYGHSEETCGKMSCRMSEPECVNDLLDLSRELITTTVHCCCATHNLCNRGDYDLNFQLGVIARIDFTKGCVGGIYKYFIKAVVIGGSFSDTVYCIHYIDFSTRKERYMVDGETSYIPVGKGMLFALQNLNWTDELQFKNLMLLLLPQPGCGGFHHQQLMQFGIVFCAATMLESITRNFCDQDYLGLLPRLMKNDERPVCQNGIYVVHADMVTGVMDEHKTTDTPLCLDEIHILGDGNFISLESRVFTPHIERHHLRFQEPNIIFNRSLQFPSMHIAHICVPTSAMPCNGLRNIMHNLMPRMMIHLASWKAEDFDGHRAVVPRSARLQSSCVTLDGEIKCTSAMGCFAYHSFDGRMPLLGCIEDIPRFHSEDPELRGVLNCRSMLWSNVANICTSIVDASRFKGRAGVLCCCKDDCPAPISDSPTSDGTGFQPFDIVL